MESWYRNPVYCRPMLLICMGLAVLLFLGGITHASEKERERPFTRPSQLSGTVEITTDNIVNLRFQDNHRLISLEGFQKVSESEMIGYVRQVYEDGAWLNDEQEIIKLDQAGRLIEEIYQRYVDDDWQNESRYIIEYEGTSEYPSIEIYQLWQNNEWVNYWRDTFTFNESGQLVELLYEDWEDGEWVPTDLFEISYTDDGQFAQVIEYSWWFDEWEADYRLTWQYDGAGREIEMLEEYWDGEEWLPEFRLAYEYDNDGNNVSQLSQYYDDIEEEWIDESRSLYSYDDAGNRLEWIMQSWDEMEEIWEHSVRFQYQYTDQGLVLQSTTSFWDGEDWMYWSRRSYHYDNDGNLQMEEIENWANEEWVYTARYLYEGFDPTNVVDDIHTPVRFELMQNYPNPFNPATTIQYFIPEHSRVTLTVYDLLGRKVVTLVDEHLQAGEYSHVFDASHLASGVYMYRLQAGEHISMKRLTLVK